MDNNNVRPDRRTKSVLKSLRRRARKRAFREASAALVEPVRHGRTVDIPFAREPIQGLLPFVEPVPHGRTVDRGRTVDIPFAREPTQGWLPFVEPVPHGRTVDIPFAIEPLTGWVPFVEPVYPGWTADIPFAHEPSDCLLPFVEPVLHGRTVDIPFACETPIDKPPFVEPVGVSPTVDIPFVGKNQVHPPFVEPVGAELTADIPFVGGSTGTSVVDDCFIEMDNFDTMDADLNAFSSCDEFSLDENENSWINGVILSDTVTPSSTKIKLKIPRRSRRIQKPRLPNEFGLGSFGAENGVECYWHHEPCRLHYDSFSQIFTLRDERNKCIEIDSKILKYKPKRVVRTGGEETEYTRLKNSNSQYIARLQNVEGSFDQLSDFTSIFLYVEKTKVPNQSIFDISNPTQYCDYVQSCYKIQRSSLFAYAAPNLKHSYHWTLPETGAKEFESDRSPVDFINLTNDRDWNYDPQEPDRPMCLFTNDKCLGGVPYLALVKLQFEKLIKGNMMVEMLELLEICEERKTRMVSIGYTNLEAKVWERQGLGVEPGCLSVLEDFSQELHFRGMMTLSVPIRFM
eukprot:scaffold345336_cov71-Attheya_sp.AAC.1